MVYFQLFVLVLPATVVLSGSTFWCIYNLLTHCVWAWSGHRFRPVIQNSNVFEEGSWVSPTYCSPKQKLAMEVLAFVKGYFNTIEHRFDPVAWVLSVTYEGVRIFLKGVDKANDRVVSGVMRNGVKKRTQVFLLALFVGAWINYGPLVAAQYGLIVGLYLGFMLVQVHMRESYEDDVMRFIALSL